MPEQLQPGQRVTLRGTVASHRGGFVTINLDGAGRVVVWSANVELEESDVEDREPWDA